MSLKEYTWKKFDYRLIIIVLIMTSISVYVIDKANSSYTQKQIVGILVGIGMMILVSIVDYHIFIKWAWVLYGVNLILLVLVKIPGIGVEVNNATRWIDVGIQIQPSELSKLILILFLAAYIDKHQERLNSPIVLLKLCVLIGVPVILVLTQPNLSTAIITFAMFCCVLFVGGLSFKIIVPILACAVPTLAWGIWYIQQPGQKLLKNYQVQRILGFLDPEKYSQTFYQQQNSMVAIGTGQLYGSLKGSSGFSVSDAGYIPESHTDFIFAIVGQEMGFIGTSLVIALFVLLVVEFLWLGKQCRDLAGTIFCTGLISLISIQALLNIGVATALMPNTGVTLPFISYGLTSLWSLMIGSGIALNVGLQRRDSFL